MAFRPPDAKDFGLDLDKGSNLALAGSRVFETIRFSQAVDQATFLKESGIRAEVGTCPNGFGVYVSPSDHDRATKMIAARERR